jgi:hypothetical protein
VKGIKMEWVLTQRKRLKALSFFWLQVYIWFGRERTPNEKALKMLALKEAIIRLERN